MIKLTVDSVVPPSVPSQEVDAICDALPEMFYEALYHVVGETAIEPWTILSFGERYPERFDHSIRPNSGHLSLVYTAWKHGLPIVTTNFDLFFEQAARHLGLKPIVSVPTDVSKFTFAEPDTGEVAIWKVHGSIDKIESVCTTMQRISRLNESLIVQLRELFIGHRVCLLGYSGRDIDLFPFVSQFPFSEIPFWICKAFDTNHAIHSCPEKFIRIEAGTETLGRLIVGRIQDTNVPAVRLIAALKHEDKLSDGDPESLRVRYVQTLLEIGRDFVKSLLAPAFQGAGQVNRRLAHAASLLSVQRFSEASKYLDEYLAATSTGKHPVQVARAFLMLSSCHHNLSKYEQAESAAVRALAHSRHFKLKEEEAESLAQRDEARRMQLLPNLGHRDWTHFLRVGTPVLVFTFVVDLFRIRRILHESEQASTAKADTRLPYTYLEHLVRLFAMLQGFFHVVTGGRVGASLLLRGWGRIQEESYRAGYAAGIANAAKYRERLPGSAAGPRHRTDLSGEEIVSSRQIFELISHRNGLALVSRDTADRYLASRKYREAARLYRECIRLSQEIGNPSLELKAYVGLARCGEQVDTNTIRLLLAEIEGAGYQRISRSLLSYVESTHAATAP